MCAGKSFTDATEAVTGDSELMKKLYSAKSQNPRAPTRWSPRRRSRSRSQRRTTHRDGREGKGSKGKNDKGRSKGDKGARNDKNRTPTPPRDRPSDRSRYWHVYSKDRKTQICRHFNRAGSCRMDRKCRFAHVCAWCFKENTPIEQCSCTRPCMR